MLRVVIPSDGKGGKKPVVFFQTVRIGLVLPVSGKHPFPFLLLGAHWNCTLFWATDTCDGICYVLKQPHPIVLHVLHPGHLGTDEFIPSRRDTLVSNSFIRPVMQIKLSFPVLSPLKLMCASPFGLCNSGFVDSLKLFRNSVYFSIPIYQVSFLVIKLREHLLKF